MKIIFFLFFVCVFCQDYIDITKKTYCNKIINTQPSNSYVYKFNSTSTCYSNLYDLNYVMGSQIFQFLAFIYKIPTKTDFLAYTAMLSMGEYQEFNKIPGFQLGDIEINEIFFRSGSTTKTGNFSSITYYTIKPFEGTTIHCMSYTLSKNTNNIADLVVNLNYTTSEVSIPIDGIPNSRIILTPNSVKWSFTFKNISYSTDKSAGIYLRMSLLSTGDLIYLNSSNKAPTTFDPYADNENQGRITFPNFGQDGGYFSYIKTAKAKQNGNDIYVPLRMYYALTGGPNIFFNGDGFKIYSVWLSSESKASEINMETFYSAPDNNNSKINMSYFILLLILLINL